MKWNFSPSVSRRQMKMLLFLAGSILAPLAGLATDSIYINNGTINNNNLPQVDATNFYNSGTWNIDTAGYPYYLPTPYQTSHTLNYTNVGTMINSVGWEFDYGPLPGNGGRGWSASFANNSSGATIEADDGYVYYPPTSVQESFLLISATNIVNKGALQAGANGELVINGGTVNLARGQLMIASPSTGGGYISGTNYLLDSGLYSETWAQTNMPAVLTRAQGLPITLYLLDSSTLWNGSSVFIPPFGVQNNCSTNFWYPDEEGWPSGWPSSSPSSFVPTVSVYKKSNPNQTNEVRQAVFLRYDSSQISADIKFAQSTTITNNFKTMAVKFTAITTNAVTLSVQTRTIYFVDTLGSETNRGFYTDTNVNSFYYCTGPRYQPANYIVSESDPVLPESPIGQQAFASGSYGDPLPPNNFLYGAIFPSSTVSNIYSAYSVYIDDLATRPSGTATTNLPGRIRINANSLDLTRAKLGAQGDIYIQASNLVGSGGAVVDCQDVSFDLSATNGNLVFTNLTKQDVSRLNGTIYAWSALWTNYWTNSQVVNGVTNTQTNGMGISVLVLDASGLSAQVPSMVDELALHGTNIIVGGTNQVDQSLLLDGQSFTLLGNAELILSGNLTNWTSAIAPTLRYFTNNGGYLFITNEAHFGDDTAVPYTEFVNNGRIKAGTLTLSSLDLQINGTAGYSYIWTYNDGFYATAQSVELANAGIYSAGDIQFSANTLQLNQSGLYADGALDFTVTNSLSDNGTASTFYCYNGFNLWIKPQTGDLLGTTVTSIASGNNTEVDSAWAGVDRGTNWSGYTNNVAIGKLVLSPQNYRPDETPLFHFYGTTGSNAMYVMTLDLSQLTNAADLTSMIQIDPGMKIYFSAVTVNSTFAAALGSQTPSAYLQSQFPGQFIKIPNFSVTQSGTVDWNTTYQPIDGFGASSAFQYWWASNQAALFFSTNNGIVYTDSTGLTTTNNGIGLSLLRTDIQPASSTSPDDTPPFPNEFYYLMLTVAQNYPYVRIWGTPWTPPAGFKSTNDIYDSDVAAGGGLNGGSFWGGDATNQAYASQLANYVGVLQSAGVTLYAISVQNEPDADITSYQACQWTGQQIHDFVPYLYNALTNNGVGSTKILLPESQNWTDPKGLAATTLNDPAAAADVSIIANHNYVPDNNTGDLTTPPPLSAGGKTTWETEVATFSTFDSGIGNGMYWADRIHLFMTVAQVNAWHYWWLVSYGTDNSGLTEGSYDSYSQMHPVLAKRLFVLGQFSRFVRPGYYRVGASTGGSYLLVSAYKDPNSQNFAIVAINTNINYDVTETFSLTNFAAGSVTPWMTSSSNSLARMPAVAVNNSSFTYFIPAQSIVTFVGQGSGGTSSNIVISSTAYNPSGHSFVLTWNATTGATYSVHKINVLSGSSTNWPAMVTGYPVGGAVGGSLSYTDTTATVSPTFYRVSSP